MGDAHRLAAGQAAETELGKVRRELGGFSDEDGGDGHPGFWEAPASLERGLPHLPQGACGHLSLQHGGDESELVVFSLCVTAGSEFTGSSWQLCLKRSSVSVGCFSFSTR